MGLKERLDKVQNEAVQHIKKALIKNRKTYTVMPTGTGKTRVGVKAIGALRKKRILWLTQTDELIFQTMDTLKDFFPNKSVGLVKSGIIDLDADIVVASVQSIHKEEYLSKFSYDYFDLIIIDEVHHIASYSWSVVVDYFSTAKCLGLTATDKRLDGRRIEQYIGECCYRLPYHEAVEGQLIAEARGKLIVTNSVIEGVETDNREYSPKQLEILVTSVNRNQIIVDSYKKYGVKEIKKRGMKPKGICFCIDIPHAIRMAEIFNSNGIKSQPLYGVMPKRDKVYKQFKETHEIEMLCVVDVLNEGKNVPDVNLVLMVRPTKSPVVYGQQLGRATRLIEMLKEVFFVLDYVDNSSQDLLSKNFINTMAMSYDGVSHQSIKEEDIVLDYYYGADPIIKDKIIKNVMSTFIGYEIERITWTKELCIKRLYEHYLEKGSIAQVDLTSENNLPSRRILIGYFGSYENALREAGICIKDKRFYANQSEISKNEVSRALIEYCNTHGLISIQDVTVDKMGFSRKMVERYFKNFKNAVEVLGLVTKQNKWKSRERIKKAAIDFYEKEGRRPKYDDYISNSSLPYWGAMKEEFDSLANADIYIFGDSNAKPVSDKPKEMRGIYKRTNGKYRVQLNFNGKTTHIGHFENPESAISARDEFMRKKGLSFN